MTEDSSIENPPMGNTDPREAWLGAVLDLRKELRFESRSQSGTSFVVVEDPVRNKFFQIGEREYGVIASFDGTQALRQLVESNSTGDVNEDLAIRVAQWLVQNNLAYASGADSSKRINQQVSSSQKAQLAGKLNPFSLKTKLFNPTRLLDAVFPVASFIFTKWFLIIWTIVAVMAMKTIYGSWDQMGSASIGIFSSGRWIWMLLLWLLLKVVHEGAHGIACRKYGGEVPEAGVLFLLFTPMPYVNVTSMWRFPSPWQRIVVSAAGMYVELFFSFIAILVWQYADGLVSSLAFDLFIMASVTTILFNANPLMRFDGYFILSDLLGIPNLYPKGTAWFGDRMKSLLLGTPKTPNLIPAGEFPQAAIYGSLAFGWKLLISISLTIGASVLFPKFGALLAIVAGVFWVAMPLFNQYKRMANSQQPIRGGRVAISAVTLLCALGALFFVFRAPATKSAPALVQYADETIVRSQAGGFVDEVFVTSGEQVATGQRLATLRNRELEDEVTTLACRVEEAKIQIRIHKQNEESGLARAVEETLGGLVEQWEDKKVQAQSLVVTAPFDGFVFDRNLDSLAGRFIRPGDPMLNIARDATKEIVVSIDQRDLESVRQNKEQDVRVLFSGMPVLHGRMVQFNPRATTVTTHPTLSAHLGGSLDVRPSTNPNQKESDPHAMELLDPRFTAHLAIESDNGKQLHSGQRGWAFIRSSRQSMGSYLYLAAHDWLQDKIELATQAAIVQ